MRSALASLALLSTGCGAIAQTIVGWRSEEPVARREESKQVRVAVDPNGAEVSRIEEGKEISLGTAPLIDSVTISVEERRRSPSFLAVLIGGVVEVGLSVGAFVLGRGQEKCFADGECYRTRDPNKYWYIGGGASLALGIADLITAWAHGASASDVAITRSPTEREYVVRQVGFIEARRTIDVSQHAGLSIALIAPPPPPPPPPVPPPPPPQASWVVAVMPIEGDTMVQGLGDQLRVFVGQRGCKTIDRTSTEAAFKERAAEVKMESYANCYNEACHIELGKALAASHILRAQLLRYGQKCVLNAELIDLVKEVAVSAASSEGKCEDEGFLLMSEKVAKALLR